MTQLTPNIGLILYNSTTDATASFLAWRLANDGDGGASNMSLIDTAIGADRARLTALEALSTIIPVSATYDGSGSNYSATSAAILSYTNALVIQLKLNLTNPGATTLNINSFGVRPLVKLDTTGVAVSLVAGDLAINRLYLFNYNTSLASWVIINGNSADQVNIAGTAGNLVTVNTDKSLLGTLTQSLMLSQTTHSATTKVTPIDTDEIPLVDTAASNVLKRILISDLKTYISTSLGALIAAATAKSTPVGADLFGIADSAAANATKKVTLTQIWAVAGTLIAALTAKTTAASGDRVLLSDISGDATKKMALSDLMGVINTLTSKTTPVAGDLISIYDSVALAAKSLSFTNLLAYLQTNLANATTLAKGFLPTLSGGAPSVLRGDGSYGGIYAPEGFLQNGVITPTVSSNNLTVAIKTLAGANPSATDPVYIRLNGVVRSITSALSVTTNAGTNWMQAGSADLATNEIDFFCYLGWNASLGSVVIGFSRVPGVKQYGDFSATSTNALYCAISNITGAASTDYYSVIGRFAATNSGTASFNWSVPTYNAANLVNYPIFATRPLTIAPTITGFSANPTSTSYTYIVDKNIFTIYYNEGTNGTSNATTFTETLPFTVVVSTAYLIYNSVVVADNGTLQATPGRASVTSGASVVTIGLNASTTAGFTASGGKRLSGLNMSIRYM